MAIDRKRRMEYKEVSTLYVEYLTLDNLHKEIEGLIDIYGADAMIYKKPQPYSYDHDYYFAVCVLAPETDEQYNNRINYEENGEKLQEIRDEEEYKRLQAKFGNP